MRQQEDGRLMLQHRRGCLCCHIFSPAVTLTFDLQNLTRSSIGASDYFLLSFIKFMRYGVHKI